MKKMSSFFISSSNDNLNSDLKGTFRKGNITDLTCVTEIESSLDLRSMILRGCLEYESINFRFIVDRVSEGRV